MPVLAWMLVLTPGWAFAQTAPDPLDAVAVLRSGQAPGCSATLISPDLAVTAAHCVANRVTGETTDPAALDLVFLPGTAQAFRLAVAEVAVPPDYASDVAVARAGDLSADLALLRLRGGPPDPALVTPLSPAPWPDPQPGPALIVGHERDGPPGPDLRRDCPVIAAQRDVVVLGCDVVAGLSGAAVLLPDPDGGPPRLVASVSSRGGGAAYVVSLLPRIEPLRLLVAE